MIVAGLFAAVAVWTGTYLLWRQGTTYLSAGLFALQMVAIAGVAWASLGLPKPLRVEYPLPEKAAVLGFALVEPKEIDLMLAMPDGPRLYRMPWDEKQAAALSDADGKAKAQHAPLMMSMSAADGKDAKKAESGTRDKEKPMFYPQPRAPLPDKQGE